MITIGTAIASVWVILVITSRKTLVQAHRLLLTSWALVSLYLNSGYFFKLGSLVITFDEMILVVAIVIGIFLQIPRAFTRKYLILSTCLLFSLLIGIALLEWHPVRFWVMPPDGSWDHLAFGVDEQVQPVMALGNLLRVIRVALFMMVYAQLEWVIARDNDGQNRLRRVIVAGAIVTSGISVLELVTWRLLGQDYVLAFIRAVFGNLDSQVTNPILLSGQIISLQGLMRESSHFAVSLLPALLILITTDCWPRITRQRILIGLLAVLALSSSLTAVVVITCTSIVWLVHKQSRRDVLWLLVLGGLAISILFVVRPELPAYWFQRILRSIAFMRGEVDALTITSETVRLTSLSHALSWFVERPLFGIGIGSGVVHGSLLNILSNVGLVGFFFWLAFLLTGNVRANVVNKFVLFIYFLMLIPVGDIGYMYSGNVAIVFLTVFRQLQVRSPSSFAPPLSLVEEG